MTPPKQPDYQTLLRRFQSRSISPKRVGELIEMTDVGRRALARMLGFGSENSLRQCEQGLVTLSAEKAAWLEGYAALRANHAGAETAWLEKNPPPSGNSA